MTNELNRELFTETANEIEKNPDAYDQWYSGIHWDGHFNCVELTCNTPCCIAGWFLALTDQDKLNRMREGDPMYGLPHKGIVWEDPDNTIEESMFEIAREKAGMNEGQAIALFNEMWPKQWLDGRESPLPMLEERDNTKWIVPTPEQAVTVLRRIAKHGMVTFYRATHFYERYTQPYR